MPKCVYCGENYENPRGLTLVMTNGTINYLCSGKCRKNMKMKRRKVRWVSKVKKEKVVSALPSSAPSEDGKKKEVKKSE